MIGIYQLKNTVNGKIYVGKSKNISIRWREHVENTNKDRFNTKLYSSLKKYGVNSFRFDVIEECSIENLNEREKHWIKTLGSIENGYNMTEGGDGGDIFSTLSPDRQEEKRKIHSEQGKERVKAGIGIASKSQKGKHITESCPEIKEKWKNNHKKSMKEHSERRQRGDLTDKEVKGIEKIKSFCRSPEEREKRSNRARGTNNSRYNGPYTLYNPQNEKVITCTFMKELVEYMKTSNTSIIKRIKTNTPWQNGYWKGHTVKRG